MMITARMPAPAILEESDNQVYIRGTRANTLESQVHIPNTGTQVHIKNT